jgi:hypothetical protein
MPLMKLGVIVSYSNRINWLLPCLWFLTTQGAGNLGWIPPFASPAASFFQTGSMCTAAQVPGRTPVRLVNSTFISSHRGEHSRRDSPHSLVIDGADGLHPCRFTCGDGEGLVYFVGTIGEYFGNRKLSAYSNSLVVNESCYVMRISCPPFYDTRLSKRKTSSVGSLLITFSGSPPAV